MEAASTPTVTQLKGASSGWKIFSKEEVARLKPTIIMSTATTSPETYSIRAWP